MISVSSRPQVAVDAQWWAQGLSRTYRIVYMTGPRTKSRTAHSAEIGYVAKRTRKKATPKTARITVLRPWTMAETVVMAMPIQYQSMFGGAV